MPRVHNSEIDDDQWDDPTELEIEDDDPVDRNGNRVSPRTVREDKNWEENRRKMWRKRNTNWD